MQHEIDWLGRYLDKKGIDLIVLYQLSVKESVKYLRLSPFQRKCFNGIYCSCLSDLDKNVSYNAQIRLLDEKLDLLSPKQRFALILFYVFDTDLSEIADLYNLKELKVKSILADSRKKLNMPIPFFRWVLSYQLSLQPPKRFVVDDLISNTYYKTGVEQYRPY